MLTIGSKVKLTQDIFDDGEDHHPPGFCAKSGEIVIVRSLSQSGKWLGVAHEGVIDSSFVIYPEEYEAL